MRTAVQLTADAAPWPDLVAYVVEAERMGVDMVWVAEAWGSDAASPLGYLAARTSRILLGSGVFQLGVRSAAMTAQTALTLAAMSGNRFALGLGTSGPQVMEGLHGVPFAHPLGRMRETLDVIRLAFAGERITADGKHVRLPLPDSEGKALRLSIAGNDSIPIYLATMSPKMLELTGEQADGWLGTSFVPEGADAYFEHLRRGADRACRPLADLDICQGAEVAFARDDAELAAMIDARRPGVAFSLGGMGSASTNFYNEAYARQGFADVARDAQARWIEGDRAGAAALIPDELVLATTLIGTEQMVRDRLALWDQVGVTTARLYPAGETLDERLDTLGRVLDMVPGSRHDLMRIRIGPNAAARAAMWSGEIPQQPPTTRAPWSIQPAGPGDEVVDIDLDEAPVGHLEVPALRVGAEPALGARANDVERGTGVVRRRVHDGDEIGTERGERVDDRVE